VTTTDREASAPLGEVGGAIGKMRYLPALDGLRALAVLAVVGYHADVSWLQGGFLGVDVFFVVSGFLITALLLREHATTGRVDLKAFWVRRFRRLLPALGALLVVTAMVWHTTYQRDLVRIRAQFGAAITYVSNWYLVATNGSYFTNLGRPSPLLHLWSLAVEEQFYLVWPIFIGVLAKAKLTRHSARFGLALVFTAIGATSQGLMTLLYQRASGGTARVDPSRMYFGTDTRLAGLALGAALGALIGHRLGSPAEPLPGQTWTTNAQHARAKQTRSVREFLGLLSIVAIAASFVGVSDVDRRLYLGGFFGFSLLAVLVITAAVQPDSPVLGRILSWKPLRIIGMRAYGIYLWHWPVVVMTRPGVDVNIDANLVLAVRVLAPLVLAEISYRIIEQPMQRRRSSNPPEPDVAATKKGPKIARGVTASMVAAIALLTSALVWTAKIDVGAGASANDGNGAQSIEISIREGQKLLESQRAATSLAPAPRTSSTATSTTATSTTATSTRPASQGIVGQNPPVTTSVTTSVAPAATTTATTTTTVALPARTGIPMLIVGDSVMVGASPAITKTLGRQIRIEAEVGRQLADTPPLLRKFLDAGVPEVLLLNLGNNGPGNADSFEKLLQISSGIPLVIVSTVKVPKRWEAEVNRDIYNQVLGHPNVIVFDWNTVATRSPELLYSDGTHLNREGAATFAQSISALISSYCLTDPPTSAATLLETSTTTLTQPRCVRAPVPGFTPTPTTASTSTSGPTTATSTELTAPKPTNSKPPIAKTSAPKTPTPTPQQSTPSSLILAASAPSTTGPSVGQVVVTTPAATPSSTPAKTATSSTTRPSQTTKPPATVTSTAVTTAPTPPPTASLYTPTAPPPAAQVAPTSTTPPPAQPAPEPTSAPAPIPVPEPPVATTTPAEPPAVVVG
jgi:peptidoglycan/LPS O-acetylase OafA/YrhL